MHNQSISSAARKRRADHGHAETALVADNRFGEIRRSSRRRGKMRMALTALAALVGFKGAVLADLGIRSVDLLSNNAFKVRAPRAVH